ncbi:MAG: SDR family oxidoreductase [Planctomycetota bacterium]|jgi:UDP-glucose 4-epimerase|nr:SDR family oxidoreductase [Planctomycetota bacterium]
MPRNRFLVTGCAGFIGGHMVERLLRDGFDVVGVDDFSTGRRGNIDRFADGIRFMEGNLCDPEVAERAVEGVDRIIHLAAIPSVPRSLENPGESARASVMATVTLLDAARKAGVARVVQASSSSVYGDGEALPKVESTPPDPLSPYAASKVGQEYFGKAFSSAYGLDTVALRYFNVFGPRQDPDSRYAAVIPKFIMLMLEGSRPTIFGDGRATRDFTYIDNVVEGNLLAALHPGPLRGEVMNCACGNRVSLNSLVEKLNVLLGTDLPPVYAPARTGEVRHSQACIDRISAILGFVPGVGFDDGLAKTVRHFVTGPA